MKAEQAKAVELHEEKKLERFVEKRGGKGENPNKTQGMREKVVMGPTR